MDIRPPTKALALQTEAASVPSTSTRIVPRHTTRTAPGACVAPGPTIRVASTGGVVATCVVLGFAALLAGCSGSGSSLHSEAPSPRTRDEIAVLDFPRTPGESSGTLEPGTPAAPSIPGPEQTKVAWKEGVFLYRSGRYKEAAEQLLVAATGRRNNAYVHYLLGLALWKSGQTGQAEEALERAAGLEPRSPRTWINLARVRMDLGNPAGALEASESAVTIDPSNGQGLHQHGRALAALGRIDEAIESLEQGLEAEPGNGYIANTLGYVLINNGRYEEALPILESARDKLPGVGYVRNNLALAYEGVGQTDKAFQERRVAKEIRSSRTEVASSASALETPSEQQVRSLPPVPLAQARDADASTEGTPHQH